MNGELDDGVDEPGMSELEELAEIERQTCWCDPETEGQNSSCPTHGDSHATRHFAAAVCYVDAMRAWRLEHAARRFFEREAKKS